MLQNKFTAKGGFADLHVHTNFSDGKFSPEEVVRTARGLGLLAVGLTDHDGVDGINPTKKAALDTGIEIIPGVEISAGIYEKEVHILGYFLDWKAPFLVEIFENMRKNRAERMRKMLELLGKENIDIDEKEVCKTECEGTIGRLHLAHVMKEKGFVKSIQEAFGKYIGDGQPCHVKHKRLEYDKAIHMIRKAGGVPVLAHPGLSKVDRYLTEMIDAGIKGIEVFHSNHYAQDEKKYLKYAEKYSLIPTGGSDCHGYKKQGKVLMGKKRVSQYIVELLRYESGKIRESHKNK